MCVLRFSDDLIAAFRNVERDLVMVVLGVKKIEEWLLRKCSINEAVILPLTSLTVAEIPRDYSLPCAGKTIVYLHGRRSRFREVL